MDNGLLIFSHNRGEEVVKNTKKIKLRGCKKSGRRKR